MKTFEPIWRGAVLLLGGALGAVLAAAQAYSGPKCLGPVCFDDAASFDGLAQELGGPSSSGGVYGYRSQNGQAFLIITQGDQDEVGTIDLRDFADFGAWDRKDEKVTQEDIQNWKTQEGISLGSPEANVLKAYGAPSGIADLEAEDRDHKKGKKLLLYKGQFKGKVHAARFRIRDGRVSFIELESDAFVGPDCLGPYCTYGDLSLPDMFRYLSLPTPKTAVSSLLCFQSQAGQASVHFATDVEETSGVADVLLSEFPNCLHKRKMTSARRLGDWKTPEGIGLGSSEADVVNAYGPPSTVKRLESKKPIAEMKGLLAGYRAADTAPLTVDKLLIYGPRELQAVDFGIRDGKVSYIWLKESDFWLKGN